MNATNQNHQSVRLNPASIPVEAGHKYRVNYEVYDGEVGEAQLKISFDDTLESEDVVINLAEELFEVAPPVVHPDGFTNEQLFEMLEGAIIDHPLQFDVFASGGMASCVLEFTKLQGDYIPPFGTAVELVNAGETVQQQLSEAGVRCLGFFHNPDRMGVIDVTDFCRTLPQGHYEISVRVTDKHGNINERVYFGISTEPVEISAVAAPVQIGATTADVTITYNGTPPTGPGNNPFTFEVQGDLGYRPVDIISINGADYTRASEARDYVYRITLPENSTDKIGVRIFYNNKERVNTTVEVEVPEYGMTIDAFANRVYVRIDGLDAQTVAGMYRYMKFDVNDVVLSADAVNYDSATGFIELSGLTPNTSCTLKSLVFDTERASAQFSTEPAQDVPNGDFSQTEQTINLTDVQVGGQYRVSPVDYTLKSSIVVEEPVGWASVNAKTAYVHAANKNTCFIVPSTMAQNNEVTLRSVAYDHNGV
ncbi:MAG: hypothetical protein K2H75_07065, partial [Muribaculaceae bacterium]|nr:hypothetical protein [Muribaculaceae bacterium]